MKEDGNGDKLFNRKKTQEYYDLSRDQVIRVFNYFKRKGVVNTIGREQFIKKWRLDEAFDNGLTV